MSLTKNVRLELNALAHKQDEQMTSYTQAFSFYIAFLEASRAMSNRGS